MLNPYSPRLCLVPDFVSSIFHLQNSVPPNRGREVEMGTQVGGYSAEIFAAMLQLPYVVQVHTSIVDRKV